MTWFSNAVVSNFRSKRKCHGTGHSLLLLLALVMLAITTGTSGRPHDESMPVDEGLVVSDEYGDVDNVEFHHVKIVDGVMREDHPIIMYKEDFVSEDYDPNKNKTTPTKPTHRNRKYKDIAQRRRRLQHADTEKYHALAPQKMYFDVLSPTPIVLAEDLNRKSAENLHVEVVSLTDNAALNQNADSDESKQLLTKHPKKYHRRQRRDTEQHQIQKRLINPYYQNSKTSANSVQTPNRQYLPPLAFQQYSIPGNYRNGPKSPLRPQIDKRFGGPDEADRVIWKDYTPTRNPNVRPSVTKGTPSPLFSPPQATRRPARPTSAPSRLPSTAPNSAIPPESNDVMEVNNSPAKCIWAITGCCTAETTLQRSNCFERYGCSYVFWDLNPCADPIRDRITNYLQEQFEN